MKILSGPFSQIITLDKLPLKGALSDKLLNIQTNSSILHQDGEILLIGKHEDLVASISEAFVFDEVTEHLTVLPGLVDMHTHITFAGNRSGEYAMKLNGMSYQEIAAEGGGIWNTVTKTRQSTENDLVSSSLQRIEQCIKNGITTVEVKSGYGLSIEEELRMLRIIDQVRRNSKIDIVPTCLAAHIFPGDFEGSKKEYLQTIINELNPILIKEGLTNRQDIFVEPSTFFDNDAKYFCQAVTEQGFDLTVHADQFTPGGSQIAVKYGAMSADHLEASRDKDIALLARSSTAAVALPGASLGLGIPFAPARKMLDAGCSLAIASDWNPGSAPMGDLLIQGSLMAIYQKLSFSELFAAMTYRAAHALGYKDRGVLVEGNKADFMAFPTADYRDILYFQGNMKPTFVWKNGKMIL